MDSGQRADRETADQNAEAGRRVLVVDGLSETTQVLRAVFEPRGHRVDRVRAYELSSGKAGSANDGLRSQPPTVVVFHAAAGETARYGSGPHVVIGRMTVDEAAASCGERHLPHTFQFAELIRAVQSLLDEPAPYGNAA